MNRAENDPEGQATHSGVSAGAAAIRLGRNARIDTRWGAGAADKYHKYAAPTGADSVFTTAVRNEHSDGAILSRREEQLAVAGLTDEEIGAVDLGAHFPIDELLQI